MVTKEEIERINILAKKQKCEDLSLEEKDEQDTLRRKYIESMKANLKSQLEIIRPLKQDDDDLSSYRPDSTKH